VRRLRVGSYHGILRLSITRLIRLLIGRLRVSSRRSVHGEQCLLARMPKSLTSLGEREYFRSDQAVA
jgi:hypothetical protein